MKKQKEKRERQYEINFEIKSGKSKEAINKFIYVSFPIEKLEDIKVESKKIVLEEKKWLTKKKKKI